MYVSVGVEAFRCLSRTAVNVVDFRLNLRFKCLCENVTVIMSRERKLL